MTGPTHLQGRRNAGTRMFEKNGFRDRKFSVICERGFTSIYAFFSNFMSPLIEVIDVNDNACEHFGHAYICTNVALSNSPRDLSIS